MIEALREKLQAEVKALNHELHVILPDTLKKALELGDLKENADYHAAIERQGIIAARLHHLRSRLQKLSDVDLSKVPGDRVGLGSRLTVRDMATKEEVVYEIVIPDAVELEDGHISVSSPLGSAFLDRKVKETVTVSLPAGTRKFKILKLETLHDLAKEMTAEG